MPGPSPERTCPCAGGAFYSYTVTKLFFTPTVHRNSVAMLLWAWLAYPDVCTETELLTDICFGCTQELLLVELSSMTSPVIVRGAGRRQCARPPQRSCAS